MRVRLAFRRSAALLVAVIATAALVSVPGAAPASAFACSEILTAGPGPTPGSVQVTFDPTTGPYIVGARDRVLRTRLPDFTASTTGTPTGTVLGGLEPSTGYWVYVLSFDGDCTSGGVWVVTAAAGSNDVWLQAYGRQAQADLCDPGWWPSYADWPNGHRGGWTCDRYVSRFG